MQKINHSRHENDPTPDAQEAHQHTHAKSQQENDKCHGDRTALRVSTRKIDSNHSIFLSRAPPATSLAPAANIGNTPSFFVCTEPAIFNCLLHVGLVACRR